MKMKYYSKPALLPVLASMILAPAISQAAVLAHESFGGIGTNANLATIAGYTPSGATYTNLTGSWTKHEGGDEDLKSRAGTDWAGSIAGGYAPDTAGGRQHWWEQQNVWTVSRASIQLSNSINLSVNGVYYMSFFAESGNNNYVAQLGLRDATKELMWGNGYNGAGGGVTAYYGTHGTGVQTGANGTLVTHSSYNTLFYVARLTKTNSGATDNLIVDIKTYNLSSSGVIDPSTPTNWQRSVTLSGLTNTFTHLQAKLDGGSGNYPGMDEFRLGQSWQDVTGIVPPTLPAIYDQPDSQTVAAGWPVSFSVGVFGDSLAYRWHTSSDTNYASPSPIANATNSTYAIGAVSALDATNYFVIVTNAYGAATSSVATLTMNVPNTLAWRGNVNANWDLTTANWSNTVTTATGVLFQGADHAQFTDSGNSASSISLVGDLTPSSVSVTSSSNYTFSGSGRLAGLTGITKSGTGTLTVNNANTFTGNAVISGGVLRAGNGSALGATNGNTTITNGGSLDVNGLSLGSEEIVVQGGGVGGTNAIFNSGAQIQGAIARLKLSGDTIVSAGANRWDVSGAGTGYLQGNGYSLTKTGGGTVYLRDVGDTGLGDVQILGGTLGFQAVVGMGLPGATMTVSNAELYLWSTLPPSPLTKNLTLANGTMSSGGALGSNAFHGPITLQGTNTMYAGANLHLHGPITGAGAMRKTASGPLFLEGTNTFTGVTLVEAGTVFLGAASSLASSPVIRLSPSTMLDATTANPLAGLNRGSGQSLQGVGNSATEASIYASVTNSAGSTLQPGLNGPGSLYVYGHLTLGGSTLAVKLGSDPFQIGNGVNDYIAVFGDLDLSGLNTIQITPVSTLSTQTYTILTYSGFLSGGLANLTATCSNPNYTVTVVDPATTTGSIQVTISGDPAPLVWKGGKLPAPNVWDHTVTNWMKTSTAKFVSFYNVDSVIFDDTAATNTINVTETNVVSGMVFSNAALNYTFVGGGNIGGSLAKVGTGSITFGLSNALLLSGITNDQGVIAFDPPVNQNLGTVISGNGLGEGAILKTGTNQLTLTANNTGFYGPMLVNNGVLRYNNSLALGNGSLSSTNNGTIDVNNVNAGSKNIVISGPGYAGQGALANLAASWGASPWKFVNYVTLAGDAAIGGSARLDIGTSMTGNGFKLTKVGNSQLVLNNIGDPGLGDVQINSGELTFQGSTTMGDNTKTLTVNSNAVLGLWAGANPFDKNIVMNHGSVASGGGSNALAGPISLTGTNTFTMYDNVLEVQGPVSGSGHLVKNGTATLTLLSHSYSGNTKVNAGTLVLSQATLGANTTVSITNTAKLRLTHAVTNTVGALVLNGASQPAGVYNSATHGAYLEGTGSLKVAMSGPSGPTLLTNSASGNVLSLSWPAGQNWRLQSQTNSLGTGLGTNWVYVTDGSVSSTNITVSPGLPSVFFRLVYP